jgi:hypothetical protein
MTKHPHSEDLRQVLREAHDFGHREHVHLAWRFVRQCDDLSGAEERMRAAIREVAALHGMLDKYHETLSGAWIQFVAAHVRTSNEADFATFIKHNEELLDTSLPKRHYSREILQSDGARRAFVEPTWFHFRCSRWPVSSLRSAWIRTIRSASSFSGTSDLSGVCMR